ncbi:MAG: DNA polymerase III subunit delta [Chloroflexi bacterium]|nr:DNA polymerase III subunit delta [Chloroflexota bacterium]
MADSPTVYLFHGDDENAMHDAVAGLQSKLGDAAAAGMNTASFEGPSISFDALRNAAQATPFLATRRLVTLKGASKVFSAEAARERFLQFLEQIPPSTALVLMEIPELNEKHWLVKWMKSAGGRGFVREFNLPKGAQMAAWIREKANELGGEIQPQAAAALAQLIGSDKEAATREIEKLLAYAAYHRPVEAADVATISLPSGEQGDFFALIDSLTSGHGARAMEMLEALFLERDHIMLFFSLVGHFRLLLQARELVDTGRGDINLAKELGIHPYRAEKLAAQARRFSMGTLEAIYNRLVELDEQIKTGKIETGLAMEIFVAELSAQTAS